MEKKHEKSEEQQIKDDFVEIEAMLNKGNKDPRFVKRVKLGEGSYGVVYKVEDTTKKFETFAIKKIKLSDKEEEDEGIPSTTLREVSILLKVNHPNIVK